MRAWVKEQFRDEERIRLTLARVTMAASVVGFALVVLGCLLAR